MYPCCCRYCFMAQNEEEIQDGFRFFPPTPGRPPFQGGPGGPGPGGSGGPGRPPGRPPMGGQDRPPSGPPPTYVPQRPRPQRPGIYAVDPGAIRPCTFRYVYIWLENGRQFWAYLVFVGRNSVSGWRWNGFRWVYFGVDLRRIDSFVCL